METDRQAHWLHPLTALNYARAAVQVGLWKSEEILVSHYFHRDHHLLELGCGGGRAGLGLWQKGYHNLTITDFSPVMVDMTRHVFDEIAPTHLATIETANACSLHYADESFDGVLFAFNGLMCLRGREDRQKALPEIFRVLKPGGIFLFTANDREKGENAQAWAREPIRERSRQKLCWRNAILRSPESLNYSERRPKKNWMTYQRRVTKAENRIIAAKT
ncbi:MAG: class I SAM-dependent methyltransferase [Verrucomicrobia bacterium]|nr:class I SAM-dependent methyltransferase [Verrucomicrobiota bacterium]